MQLLRQPCCREPRRPGEDPFLAWDDRQPAAGPRGLLVRRLFLSGTEEGALALGRIAAESARFNLGQVQRTTNLPTLPLLYLVSAMHPRLYFSRGGEEEVDGTKTTILEFREDASPTLAATAAGIDMPARGRAWSADVEALATYTDLRLFSVDTSEDVGEAAE